MTWEIPGPGGARRCLSRPAWAEDVLGLLSFVLWAIFPSNLPGSPGHPNSLVRDLLEPANCQRSRGWHRDSPEASCSLPPRPGTLCLALAAPFILTNLLSHAPGRRHLHQEALLDHIQASEHGGWGTGSLWQGLSKLQLCAYGEDWVSMPLPCWWEPQQARGEVPAHSKCSIKRGRIDHWIP